MKVKILHIIIASSILAITFLLSQFVDFSTSTIALDTTNIENIEKILDAKYNSLQSRSLSIEKKLLKDTSDIKDYFYNDCKDLFTEEGVGLFLYKQNELAYWTTNNIPVPTSTTYGFFDRTYINLNNGWYLSNVIAINDWHLVSLFQIKKEYSYKNELISNSYWHEFDLDQGIFISTDSLAGSIKVCFGNDDSFYVNIPDEMSEPVLAFGFKHILIILNTILLALIIFLSFIFLCRKYSNFASILSLGLFILLFALRYLMLKSAFFNGFIEFDLFSPLLFAESFWLPSLGDYLVNVLFFTLFSIFFYAYFKPKIEFQSNMFSKWVFSISIVIFMYLSGTSISNLFYGLVWNSSISFGFDNILNLDIYSFIGTSIIVTMVLGFIIILYSLLRTLKEHLSIYIVLSALAISYGYDLVFADIGKIEFESLLIFNTLFFVLWSALAFIAIKKKMTYFLSVILLVLVSLITSEHFARLTNQKDIDAYKVITYNLAAERDVGAEFFLKQTYNEIMVNEILDKAVISKDFSSISSQVDNILSSKRYFNKYEAQTTICLCSDSLMIEPDMISYDCFEFFRTQIDNYGMIIPGSNFYFLDNHNGRISYLGEISTMLADSTFVNIYVELNSKIFSEGLGYPELLLDKKLTVKKIARNYNYAKYNKGRLISSKGDYKYQFTLEAEDNDTSEYSFYTKNGYVHFTYRPDSDNLIILSKPDTKYSTELVSFTYILSFLFLFFNLIWLTINFQRGILSNGTSLKIKIQISFITILILSLVLTGTISIYFIIQGYKEKQRETVQDKIHSVLIELEHKIGNENKLDYEDSEFLNILLVKFSNVFYTDINVYDLDGILLSSSRIELYDKGLKGRYMDSKAYNELIVNNSGAVIISENIDNIEYLSAYVPFRNYNNEIIAYLNLPYFARQSEFKEEISNFIVAFSNIFLALILISVIIGIFISRQLTRPLAVIQDKIKSMDIKKKAEKISYTRNDEIGGLIREYNRKVDELSESASKLAQSEREMAWREMAKQIAHEIKNPLTPMKLSVQYLERAYDMKDENWEQTYRKVSKTLIEQIDILSNIASEFSNFAQMPASKKEIISLLDAVNTTVQLYENAEDVDFKIINETEGKSLINADKEQILRVLTNLIRNSIQAIPDNRYGKIVVTLKEVELNYILRIKDNGSGIPEAMRSKIFQPNFTTKSSGMGLGLSMVKSLLISNSATIHYITEINEWTEFIIEIPKIQD